LGRKRKQKKAVGPFTNGLTKSLDPGLRSGYILPAIEDIKRNGGVSGSGMIEALLMITLPAETHGMRR
jgi:hypothetical protein